VKQHAGTIEVDTQPGEFTEIRIVLPRTPAFVRKAFPQALHVRYWHKADMLLALPNVRSWG
jgi:chemotaxis protein histidine kinase CheA